MKRAFSILICCLLLISCGKHEHSYTTETMLPTCTKKGYTEHTCSCGDYYTSDYTDALGHSYTDWENESKETQIRTCQRCGKTETRNIIKPSGKTYIGAIPLN